MGRPHEIRAAGPFTFRVNSREDVFRINTPDIKWRRRGRVSTMVEQNLSEGMRRLSEAIAKASTEAA
jgi:hypothetical protein